MAHSIYQYTTCARRMCSYLGLVLSWCDGNRYAKGCLLIHYHAIVFMRTHINSLRFLHALSAL